MQKLDAIFTVNRQNGLKWYYAFQIYIIEICLLIFQSNIEKWANKQMVNSEPANSCECFAFLKNHLHDLYDQSEFFARRSYAEFDNAINK